MITELKLENNMHLNKINNGKAITWKLPTLRSKTDDELQRLRKTAANNTDAGNINRSVRLNLLDKVLAERNLTPDATVEDLTATIDFDFYIANAYSAKVRDARHRGKDFSLTIGQFKTLYRRKTCYYTGEVMVNGGGIDNPLSKTLDRIDSNKGYVPGNVVCCTNKANQIKNELFENPKGFNIGIKEVVSLCKALDSKLGE
jgi:hypothetical protein